MYRTSKEFLGFLAFVDINWWEIRDLIDDALVLQEPNRDTKEYKANDNKNLKKPFINSCIKLWPEIAKPLAYINWIRINDLFWGFNRMFESKYWLIVFLRYKTNVFHRYLHHKNFWQTLSPKSKSDLETHFPNNPRPPPPRGSRSSTVRAFYRKQKLLV